MDAIIRPGQQDGATLSVPVTGPLEGTTLQGDGWRVTLNAGWVVQSRKARLERLPPGKVGWKSKAVKGHPSWCRAAWCALRLQPQCWSRIRQIRISRADKAFIVRIVPWYAPSVEAITTESRCCADARGPDSAVRRLLGLLTLRVPESITASQTL